MAVRKYKRGVVASKPQQKGIQSTVYVSASTPIPAALKRVDRGLTKGKVRVLGIGRAIQTVLQLAAALRTRKYQVEIRTLSMTAVDETVDEERAKVTMKERPVAAAELTILPHKI